MQRGFVFDESAFCFHMSFIQRAFLKLCIYRNIFLNLPRNVLLFFLSIFLCLTSGECQVVRLLAIYSSMLPHFSDDKIKRKEDLYEKHLIKAHLFYERHGGKAIILARFIPVIRTFAPFVAGIALMNPAQFFFFNIIGATAWVTGLVFMGFFLGNIPIVQENFSIVIYSIIIISISPVVFGFIRSILKKKG